MRVPKGILRFNRTMRSLEADRFRRLGTAIAITLVMLGRLIRKEETPVT